MKNRGLMKSPDAEYHRIRLLDGTSLAGPWYFISDGPGCMYPRFVREDGAIVPWHAAAFIRPERREEPWPSTSADA